MSEEACAMGRDAREELSALEGRHRNFHRAVIAKCLRHSNRRARRGREKSPATALTYRFRRSAIELELRSRIRNEAVPVWHLNLRQRLRVHHLIRLNDFGLR